MTKFWPLVAASIPPRTAGVPGGKASITPAWKGAFPEIQGPILEVVGLNPVLVHPFPDASNG